MVESDREPTRMVQEGEEEEMARPSEEMVAGSVAVFDSVITADAFCQPRTSSLASRSCTSNVRDGSIDRFAVEEFPLITKLTLSTGERAFHTTTAVTCSSL